MDAPLSRDDQLQLLVLGSGSSGNSSVVTCGGRRLMIDAGFSMKETERRLALAGVSPSEIEGVLVTHEHGDHVKCVHTFTRRHGIPFYATRGTYEEAFGGKKAGTWVEIRPGDNLKVAGMAVHAMTLPHDASDPLGFRIEGGGKILGHVTDVGYVSGLLREYLRGCDLLLIEANHDVDMLRNGPYSWPLKQRVAGKLGHLSNDDLIAFLPEVLHDGLRHLVLAHLSETNNDPRMLGVQVRRALTRLGLSPLPFSIAQQASILPAVSA